MGESSAADAKATQIKIIKYIKKKRRKMHI